MPRLPNDHVAPFWETADGSCRLFCGEGREVLRRLPSRIAQCVATSPPYWGLRSYATGDAKHLEIGAEPSPDCGTHGQAQCGRCFVCAMVSVFREVRRVLRDDGTLWLNLGDSYCGTTKTSGRADAGNEFRPGRAPAGERVTFRTETGLPSGNLVGVPWRVALALQHDGWVLRSDIPWVKRSAMPESVKNRPAKALEYVFMFVKKPGYYFDMEAVRRTLATGDACVDLPSGTGRARYDDNAAWTSGPVNANPGGRSFRNADLWFDSVDAPHGLCWLDDEMVGLDVTSEAYVGAHFATFPSGLIRPLILASTSEHGACPRCAAPWQRIVEEQKLTRERPNDYVRRVGDDGTGNSCANSVAGVETRTVGWEPTCRCTDDAWQLLTPVPCTVLDPFVGSGTTCVTALRLGRRAWGIDLSQEYLEAHAVIRVQEELVRQGKVSLAKIPDHAPRTARVGV